MSAPKPRSPLYFAWRRFDDNKAALVAGVFLLLIILMAIFAPLISKTGYADQKKSSPKPMPSRRPNSGSALMIWGAISSPASSVAQGFR
ncbi:hypothetical protein [Cypionkella sp.]|jgi:ABC-type antimicrobial peptide transport system permease subunit|uniref:hypothetical protein n=1 Tax=Cypionkella sp. TaxID=2811411 RepID=UPI00271C1D95|nr:hypothetical protein [Cypionkella sp.]MDO8985427.1 hypothetical protein [Cypionkella sp.]MDP1575377.1 hypothetical protein [Cypionkella sp.]MDP2048883.1 hypothetical protein [Cypionkella sp.]